MRGFRRGVRAALLGLPALKGLAGGEGLDLAVDRVSGVVSAKCQSPKYGGSTKDCLEVPGVAQLTQVATQEALEALFAAHP